jgi:hypothetical protein
MRTIRKKKKKGFNSKEPLSSCAVVKKEPHRFVAKKLISFLYAAVLLKIFSLIKWILEVVYLRTEAVW